MREDERVADQDSGDGKAHPENRGDPQGAAPGGPSPRPEDAAIFGEDDDVIGPVRESAFVPGQRRPRDDCIRRG